MLVAIGHIAVDSIFDLRRGMDTLGGDCTEHKSQALASHTGPRRRRGAGIVACQISFFVSFVFRLSAVRRLKRTMSIAIRNSDGTEADTCRESFVRDKPSSQRKRKLRWCESMVDGHAVDQSARNCYQVCHWVRIPTLQM